MSDHIEGAAAELPPPGGDDSADPEGGLSFEDSVITAEARFGTLGTVGSYIPPRSPGKYRGAGVGPSPTYSYSAAVIEVEVDPTSGIYRPVHVWLAHDIVSGRGRSVSSTSRSVPITTSVGVFTRANRASLKKSELKTFFRPVPM